MSKLTFIIAIVAFIVFLTVVAGGIGISSTTTVDDIEMPENLSAWDYVYNGAVFFVDLMSFQIPGVPAEVNLLFILPLMAGLGYLIFRLVRGGG